MGCVERPSFAGDAQSLGLGLDSALECDAVIGAERFHAVEMFQEIEVPHGAAELAIRGATQTDFRLPGDDAFDGRVFGGA